ncbi:dTDP-rhamnosyl transferase rfbF [Thermus scotoductus]|uniref:dTDP-rhamnosyl transferase rfbF n=1 Tax=Thermus scotoductus TaxID=37636 RepID=A0A430RI99_THESC|nr:glycosyltransferase family 2 protein [Thermus scotoductus]RTH13739.1 dTDP-rhamnosyl transferase rfbF [Thermus scotoductus]
MEKVCAVIVTFNRKNLLRECLQAVFSQTRLPDHVLVVDNASTDGSREMIKQEFPDVEVLTLPENQGSAGGFHEGIKRAYEEGYDWIWVMDDDTVPTHSALKALLQGKECLEQRSIPCDAIGSKVVWTDGRLHPMNRPWFTSPTGVKGCSTRKVALISFASIMIHRTAVARKGFPRKEFFIWNDDWEYFLRFDNVFYTDNSIVIHKTKVLYTANYSNERYYYQARNRLWILRTKDLPLPWRIVLFLHFVGEAAVYLTRQGKRGWQTILRGLKDGLKPLPW